MVKVKPYRWKQDKIDWKIFKEKCQEKLTCVKADSDPVEYFTEAD